MKFILLGWIVLGASVNAFAQMVTGPVNSYVNETQTYTLMDDATYLNYNWAVVGGTISSSTKVGFTYTAVVVWNTVGAGTISFRDNLTTISSLNVTVSAITCTSGYTVSGGGVSCGGANVNVSLSGTDSGIRYQLKVDWVDVGSVVIGNGSPLSWQVNAQGTYTVVATKPKVLCTLNMSGSAFVSTSPIPTSFTVGGSGVYCPGQANVTLNGSTVGISYQLKIDGSATGVAVNGNGSALSWPVTTTGSYTVHATNTSSGCNVAMTGSASITVNPSPTNFTVGGGGTYCTAQTQVNVTLSGSVSGTNYQLKLNENSVGSTVAGNGSALSWSANTAGSYTVQATVASSSCVGNMNSSTSVVSAPGSVGGTITPALTEFYGPAQALLSLSGHTGSVQQWQYNTVGTWNTINITNTGYSPNIATSTQYRAEVKNGSCPSIYSSTANIIVYSIPSAITANPTSLVLGDSAVLTATSGYYGYQWTKNNAAIVGQTGSTLKIKTPGTYAVKVKGSATAPEYTSASITILSALDAQGKFNFMKVTTLKQAGNVSLPDIFALNEKDFALSVSYFDFLGRPKLGIGVQQSPQKNDMVQAIAYDAYGRTKISYLPYASATKHGKYRNALNNSGYTNSEQYLFCQNTVKVETSTKPFAATVYESSPIGRTKEQGAPGVNWQPNSGHAQRMEYRVNSSAAAAPAALKSIKRWTANGPTGSNYADTLLTVVKGIDENNNEVWTFNDKMGQTVLKRVQLNETVESQLLDYLETYFVYDDRGKLVLQVPPKASAKLLAGTAWSTVFRDEWCFVYIYDTKDRLVEKKTPDAAVQYFVYDNMDRLVLTQDGNLRSQNKWSFIKYDYKGRPAYNGFYLNTIQTTRPAVQALLDVIDYNLSPWYETETANATYQNYSNTVFPTTGLTVLAANYFDHYDFDRNGSDDYVYDAAHLAGQSTSVNLFMPGSPTGSKRVLIDATGAVTTTWLTTAVFYNKYSQAVQMISTNHLYSAAPSANFDKTTLIYDFTGKVTKTKTTHYSNASTSVSFIDRTEYDHADRVVQQYRKINSDAEQLLVQLEYNELGQLVDKKLHNTGGSNFLQSVDYRYAIRGWLKSINNAELQGNVPNNDETNDYFGMNLVYDDATGTGLTTTPAYNGNISALQWKGPGQTAGDINKRSYTYVYDKSDKLKTATFKAHNGSSWAKENNTLNETLTYDANGNIKTLVRNEDLRGFAIVSNLPSVTSAVQPIDNLTYTYTAGNKLVKVEDAVTGTVGAKGFANAVNATSEYTYNIDGSQTKDDNKGVSSIGYNFLGKPQIVNFTDGRKIEYFYDAVGTKLTMKTWQGSALLSTNDYVGDFVYEAGALSFFSSPGGRVVKKSSVYEYQYAIADHQGNTRVLFTSATPSPLPTSTNLEAASNGNFNNYNNQSTLELFDHTDVGATATTSQKLTGGYSAQVGLAKTFAVYPGDKVKVEAYAKYWNPTSTSSNISGFAAMLTGAFGVTSGSTGEMLKAYTGLNSYGSWVAAGTAHDSYPGEPKGFVTILLFDKNYKFLDAAWDQLDDAYLQGQNLSVKDPFDLLTKEITVREAGYAFVFLSNESPTAVDIHFDDVTMTHTPGNIVQCNEYYPFGLQTANSWTRANTTGNNFLGNGGTEFNSTSNLYDLAFRNFDPALGRMNQVDPMADKYAGQTPYNYSFNRPNMLNDPSGADPYMTDDNWWNGPRSGWLHDGGPRAYQEYNRTSAMVEAGGSSIAAGSSWGWTGMGDAGVYGGGGNQFGSGFISGSYFGSARMQAEGLVPEYTTTYIDYGDGVTRDISTRFSGFVRDPRSQASLQTQTNGNGPGDPIDKNSKAGVSLEDLKQGPPTHPDFKSPKGGDRRVRNPNGRGSGWIDNNGDVWIPTDHNGTHAPHWERQIPGGSYENIYPTVTTVVKVAVVGVIVYEVVKWGVAIFLVPETLGGSLGVAAAMP